jgi:hypothetical protein
MGEHEFRRPPQGPTCPKRSYENVGEAENEWDRDGPRRHREQICAQFRIGRKFLCLRVPAGVVTWRSHLPKWSERRSQRSQFAVECVEEPYSSSLSLLLLKLGKIHLNLVTSHFHHRHWE